MAKPSIPSPDSLVLRAKPLASVRVNKKAAYAAVGIIAVLLVVITSNVSGDEKSASRGGSNNAQPLTPALNAASSLTKAPPGVPLTPTLPHMPRPPAPSQAVPGPVPYMSTPSTVAPPPLASDRVTLPSQMPATAPATRNGPAYVDNTAESRQAARQAGSAASGFDGEAGPLRTAYLQGAQAALPASGTRLAMLDPGQIDNDPNRQAQKQAFREQAAYAEDQGVLASRVRAQQSPYELKTGTVIPAVMIGAINSDLPGEIVAQISQNVFDSASGQYLLIPQGARLFGRYDSNVSFGQGRLQIAWQRLIFPNGSTLDLKGMNGHDAEGNGGFADQVNNHYGRIFGWALATSLLSAGYQLSQPRQQTISVLGGGSEPSAQQIVGAAVGQQIAQLGTEMARKNMQIQPTITVRKGYQFVVMVNKDVVFPDTYAAQ